MTPPTVSRDGPGLLVDGLDVFPVELVEVRA
jgi:hypothetical protein